MPRKPRAPKQNGHVRVLSDGSPEGTRLSVNGFIVDGVQGIEFSATPYGVTCMVRIAVKDVDLTAWPEGITVVAETPGTMDTFHAVPSPMDSPVSARDILDSTRALVDEATAAERYPSVTWDDPTSDPIRDIERAKALYAERTGMRAEDVTAWLSSGPRERVRKTAAEMLREARERREADLEAREAGLRLHTHKK